MSFLDRFRRPTPRHQHADPVVRASAVRELSDQDVLESIARGDADAQVRKAALKRLRRPAVVAEVCRRDADGGVREEAAEQLQEMSCSRDAAIAEPALAALPEQKNLVVVARQAPLEHVRRRALDRLTDPRLLLQVARSGEEADVRQAAFERLVEPAAFAELALRCEHREVALAAVERIDDRELLEQVAARAKNRAAAKRARARLGGPAPAAPIAPAGPAREERLRLIQALESLAHSEEWERMTRQAAESRDTWREWGGDAELDARFAAAAEAVEVRVGQHEEERIRQERAAAQAAEEAERRRAEEAERRRAEAEKRRAEAAAPRERPQPAPEAPAPGRLEEIAVALEKLAEDPDPAAGRGERSALRREWYRLCAQLPPAEELRARVDAALVKIEAKDASVREAREKEEKEASARLQGLLARIVALPPDTPRLKEANALLREAKEAIDDPGPLPREEREAVLGKLREARAALFARVQELRDAADWKRWASAGLQEELAGKAEALLALENVDDADRQMRDLELRWKQAGPAPKEQGDAIWQRFKAARDQVRTKAGALREQRGAAEAENLKKKMELVERAEALAESSDWLKTADEIKALQTAWKEIGAVPRRSADEVWNRFRGACNKFFERRKQDLDQRKDEWSKNLAAKEALIARVEALASSSEWEAGIKEVKACQAEWKKTGPVRKNKSEQVWQRFKGACDAYFERYRKRGELQDDAQAAAREAVLSELEALGVPPFPEDLGDKVVAALQRFRQAPEPGAARAAALEKRMLSLRDRLVLASPASFEGTDLDPSATEARMQKLIARVEAVAKAPSDPLEASLGKDLASRLKEALASNTIAGRGEIDARQKAAQDEVKHAQAAWAKLGPVPADVAEPLRQRFEQACAEALARAAR